MERLVNALRNNPRESTLYRNFDTILTQIISEKLNGMVIIHEHNSQGFCVFEEEKYKLNVSMIYTHSKGPNKELTIFTLKALKGIAGDKDLVFVEDQNNSEMISYFERAAKLAGITYFIKRS